MKFLITDPLPFSIFVIKSWAWPIRIGLRSLWFLSRTKTRNHRFSSEPLVSCWCDMYTCDIIFLYVTYMEHGAHTTRSQTETERETDRQSHKHYRRFIINWIVKWWWDWKNEKKTEVQVMSSLVLSESKLWRIPFYILKTELCSWVYDINLTYCAQTSVLGFSL